MTLLHGGYVIVVGMLLYLRYFSSAVILALIHKNDMLDTKALISFDMKHIFQYLHHALK